MKRVKWVCTILRQSRSVPITYMLKLQTQSQIVNSSNHQWNLCLLHPQDSHWCCFFSRPHSWFHLFLLHKFITCYKQCQIICNMRHQRRKVGPTSWRKKKICTTNGCLRCLDNNNHNGNFYSALPIKTVLQPKAHTKVIQTTITSHTHTRTHAHTHTHTSCDVKEKTEVTGRVSH